MGKWIATATAAALVIATAGPVSAQSYGLAQQLDDEAGATVSLNYRMPLGGGRQVEEPSYGMTLNWGYRDALPGYDDGEFRPNLELADLRFNGDGLVRTEIASFNLMRNADGQFEDPRLNLIGDDGEKDATTYYIIGGIVLVAVGFLVFDSDDDDEDDD